MTVPPASALSDVPTALPKLAFIVTYIFQRRCFVCFLSCLKCAECSRNVTLSGEFSTVVSYCVTTTTDLPSEWTHSK